MDLAAFLAQLCAFPHTSLICGWIQIALRNLLLKQEHYSLQVQAQAILFRSINSCISTTCQVGTWSPGGRPALALGTGILGSRCSEHGLDGTELQVTTPPDPLWLPAPEGGCNHRMT